MWRRSEISSKREKTIMTKKRKPTTTAQDIFITGGILGVLGIVVIAQSHDLITGLFLIGLGVVIMASSSKELRKEVFEFFFGILKGLWKLLSRSD